jgi:hypothetical protein
MGLEPSSGSPSSAAFAEGIEHFNAGRFWHAHESWESIWLVADEEIADFYQGLIQLAAAYHHLQRGTTRGAIRLFAAALGRLSAYPEQFCGLDRRAACAAAVRHSDEAAAGRVIAPLDYPKLALTGD